MMRVARRGEIDQILDWAAAEGWNPGLDDAEAFYTADPAGFFVAEREGQIVAAISVVNHSAEFAFLGLYLCLPAWRGQGIGFGLWAFALAHASGRCIGLDGVAAQQDNYARSGFALAGATRRFEGTIDARRHADVRAVQDGDAAALAELDRTANGFDRPVFLAAWTNDTPTRRTLVLDSGTGAQGFATIRTCRIGAKIGPVIAPTADAALVLVKAAVAALPSPKVIIDLPDQSHELAAKLQALGFVETFATARMYKGEAPAPSPSLQAIATMELG